MDKSKVHELIALVQEVGDRLRDLVPQSVQPYECKYLAVNGFDAMRENTYRWRIYEDGTILVDGGKQPLKNIEIQVGHQLDEVVMIRYSQRDGRIVHHSMTFDNYLCFIRSLPAEVRKHLTKYTVVDYD